MKNFTLTNLIRLYNTNVYKTIQNKELLCQFLYKKNKTIN